MCVISFYQKRLVSFSLFPELLIVHFACFFPAYVHFTCFFPGNGLWSYLGVVILGQAYRVSYRCWEHGGGLFKIWCGGLSQHMGEYGGLKMLLKKTCEVVHLLVKLPAISLEAWKFTKNELLHTFFSRILARF